MTTDPAAPQHGPARLSAATLAAHHPDKVPRYERTGPRAIAHLGVGAFMRAHLATYAEDLLALGWPARIHGVSLRGDRAERQLAPQDGLYSLTVREPDRPAESRIVGSIVEVSTGSRAAIDAIASRDTQLVTLTVTEKGYRHPGSTTGASDGIDRGGIDIAEPSAASVIARGLAARDRSLAPPVFASLDNLTSNGSVLRSAVLDAAERLDGKAGLDGDLAAWIASEVRFADSVVDRLVPATTTADLADVERRLGLRDEGAVTCEAHRSWVISRVDGLPPLSEVGVVVTDDVGPYEHRKLWLLNGPHSALAYAGLIAGCTTIAEAATHPLVGPFARRIADAALEVVAAAEAVAAHDFATASLRRFANPALGHTCAQVGADGSEKLRQRILPVVGARMRHGLDVADHASLVACWLACASGMEVQGIPLPNVVDPIGPSLVAALCSGGIEALVAAGIPEDSPTGLAAQVLDSLLALQRTGSAVLEVHR